MRRRPPRPDRIALLVLGLLAAGLPSGPASATAPAGEAAPLPDTATLRRWIQELEASPRGPFERLRWFCADGTVHPPKPYPCEERGGGVQHGEWNERTLAMREGGYRIGNVFAGLDAQEFVGPDANLDGLKQILLERFLVGWDDGWIFRGARTYRGALQIEDEEAGGRALLLALLADPRWRDPSRFYLLRETARLVPLQGDEGTASLVRQQALRIAEKDPGFTDLRAKIHNAPDAGDAEKVRAYAGSRGKPALAPQYEELALGIDQLYAKSSGADLAIALAPRIQNPDLARALREMGDWLAGENVPQNRLEASARLMGLIRKHFPDVRDPERALAALRVSLALEDDAYTAGNTLLTGIGSQTRRQRLTDLDQAAEALYGTGFLSLRQLAEVKYSIARVEIRNPTSVDSYREEAHYLARVPEWSGRWIEFEFGPTVAHWAPIEPDVHLYTQDRQRGSPLLFYGAVIDGLVLDANRLAGVQHELFGQSVGAGLRALNPGLARGVLRAADGRAPLRSNGIYLLPETTADLPPVAGILTQGEGSSLSHVQLLARNLGIPNVVVGEELLPRVRGHAGTAAVLAVSPGGVVQLDADSPRWNAVFGTEQEESRAENVVIRPDLQKLDLSVVTLIPLAELRAADSGRVAGPKGANLGELRHAFGSLVPDGFVIPFGVFRKLLDQPLEPGGPPVFAWMKHNYAAIAAERDPERREQQVSRFLARLREWIEQAPLDPAFETELRAALRQTFGPDGSYGVFVRSDTNVEDLAGFTGAGLNLTVPNVVGTQNILRAVRAVWASPFTERAYSWRQAHMESPEYVFPAVVVQRAFASEKSGVMVTTDVEDGKPGWISVAVSEGPGGAVEGQATESLRIDTKSGDVRLLAQATAPERAVLSPAGGITQAPASGTDTLLEPDEIQQLIAFAGSVHERFPSLVDAAGRPMPADVEFAFKDGKLALLQIRPFVESRRAQSSTYLRRLDAGLAARGNDPVDLDAVPGTGTAPREPAAPAEAGGAR
jgi:Pyruvate phosphate dikinase, AMP/ATP-binding domain/PEP-utilising enzyme, mobile domain